MRKIFFLMGKSSSGKDSFFKHLIPERRLTLKPLVGYTTRPIRVNEQEGREYHFVDQKKLEELEKAGKVIERRDYHTVHGIWSYFTVDDKRMDLEHYNYLYIGTLESYVKLREYYGRDIVYPLYIEVEDGIRLQRALLREQAQDQPKYAEMCRRFLADQEDFSEEKLKEAGITKRYFNNGNFEKCYEEIVGELKVYEN